MKSDFIPKMTFKTYNTKLASAGSLMFCKMGRVKGRNLVLKAGFSKCPNPNYFQKESIIVHHNSKMNGWIMYEETSV
jgi:hypothetical protein